MPTLYYEGVCVFAGRPGFNTQYNPFSDTLLGCWKWWNDDWGTDSSQSSFLNEIWNVAGMPNIGFIKTYAGANFYWCPTQMDVYGATAPAGEPFPEDNLFPPNTWPVAGMLYGNREAYHTWLKTNAWGPTWDPVNPPGTGWGNVFATFWSAIPIPSRYIPASPSSELDIPEYGCRNATNDSEIDRTKTGSLAAMQSHYLGQTIQYEFLDMESGAPTGEWATLELTWNKWTNEVTKNSSFSQSMLTRFDALKDQYPTRDDVPDTIIPSGASPGDWMPWDLPMSRDIDGNRVPMTFPHLYIVPPFDNEGMHTEDVIISETEVLSNDAYLLLGHGSRGDSDLMQVRCTIHITLTNPFTQFEFRQLVEPLRLAVHSIKPVIQSDPSTGTLGFNNQGGITMVSGAVLWINSVSGTQFGGMFSDWHGEAPPPVNGFIPQIPVCDCYGFIWGGHPHCLSSIRPEWDYGVMASYWGDGFITATYFVSRWYLKTADVPNLGSTLWYVKDYTHELAESFENDVRTDSMVAARGWVRPDHPALSAIGQYDNLYAFTRIELTASPDSVQWLCQDQSLDNYHVTAAAPDAYLACLPLLKYLPEPLHPDWPTQGPYVQF